MCRIIAKFSSGAIAEFEDDSKANEAVKAAITSGEETGATIFQAVRTVRREIKAVVEDVKPSSNN
jgi:hypothetical protein